MKKSLILALFAAAVLAACGGNDHKTPAATSEVPASASESVAGFIGYLKRLVVADADTLEPVDVSAVTPPADDGVEPDVVD